MEQFEEAFKAIWDTFWEVLLAFFGVIPKVLHFVLWVLAGLIVLPCVFVAGSLYPGWVKWGEDF